MTSSNADSRRQFSLVQLKFLHYLYKWDNTTLCKCGTKVPHFSWWQFILIAGQVLRCLRKGNCEHDSTEESSFASTAYGNTAQCWDGVHLRASAPAASSAWVAPPLNLHIADSTLSPKSHLWRSFSWSLYLEPTSLPIPIPSVILYPHGLAFFFFFIHGNY